MCFGLSSSFSCALRHIYSEAALPRPSFRCENLSKPTVLLLLSHCNESTKWHWTWEPRMPRLGLRPACIRNARCSWFLIFNLVSQPEKEAFIEHLKKESCIPLKPASPPRSSVPALTSPAFNPNLSPVSMKWGFYYFLDRSSLSEVTISNLA